MTTRAGGIMAGQVCQRLLEKLLSVEKQIPTTTATVLRSTEENKRKIFPKPKTTAKNRQFVYEFPWRDDLRWVWKTH